MNARPSCGAVAFLIGLLSLGVQPVDAHKFHASLAEAEYNDRDRRVEISLRLFPDDLEEALGRSSGIRVRLDDTPNVDRRAVAYLRERLALVDRDGHALDLEWVGMEIRVDEVWLYVQAPSTVGLDGATVSDRIFFELFDDQVNTLNLKQGRSRTTLVFKPGDGPRTVAFAHERR